MLNLILIVIGSVVAWFVLGKVWQIFIVPYFRTEVNQIRTSIIPQEQKHANQIDDRVCCFCLAQPKVFRLVATCAHSFCADCILGYYKKNNHDRIDCPLCRKDVITLFKAFQQKEPQTKIEQIRQKIREYNNKFGDDRSIKRTIKELPVVIQNTMNYLFSKDFLLFFIGNAIFLKAVAVIIFYQILPYDVLPAKLLGSSVGCIDDTLVVVLVLGFAIGKVGLQFYRNHQ